MGRLVVPLGRLDVERPTVQRQRPSVVLKLVALGVSAKVVVVVEDEHPGVPTDVFDKEVSRGEPADTATDDHEVVSLTGVGRAREVPSPLIAELVSDLERAVVTSAHAGARRRVVVVRLLRRKRLRRVQRLNPPRHDEGGTDRYGHTLNEVTAGD